MPKGGNMMKFRELTSIFKFECEEAARRSLADLAWFTKTWQWYYFSVSELSEDDGIEVFITRGYPVSHDLEQMRRFNALIYDLPGSLCSVWNGFVIAFSANHAQREIEKAYGL
jgi:hypothetical protein